MPIEMPMNGNLPQTLQNQIEFSLSLLRIAHPGEQPPSQVVEIERLVSSIQPQMHADSRG